MMQAVESVFVINTILLNIVDKKVTHAYIPYKMYHLYMFITNQVD